MKAILRHPATAAALLFAGLALLLLGALVVPPTERTMGDVQRIFYFHVGAATQAALAYVVAALAGALYLARREEKWDRLGRAAVETGTLFATIVLVTGPIWARSAWGTWWTWEPRLMTTLIVWLVYLGALVVRGIASDREQAARLAAVIAIVGVVNLPIVYKSVDWWRGHHPIVLGREGGLAPGMREGLLLAVAGVAIVHGVVGALRLRQLRARDGLESVERALDEREGVR